jgi:hypothetical protein
MSLTEQCPIYGTVWRERGLTAAPFIGFGGVAAAVIICEEHAGLTL